MTKKIIIAITYCLGLISAMGVFLGCIAKDHIISRPTIKTNSDWQMVESCGYEGCRPMVDFLSTKDIRIRIEAFNYMKSPNLFLITISFFGEDFYTLKSPKSDEYEFNPSDVTVKLNNGKVLKPKGFTCSYTRWDKRYLQSASPIEGAMTIKQNNCFLTIHRLQ